VDVASLPTSAAPWLTAAEAAFALSRLGEGLAAAFETIAVSSASAYGVRRVALASRSRVLGEHAQSVVTLVPESVLLADARALGSVAANDYPRDAEALVVALERDLATISAQASEVADAALLRLIPQVASDLAAARRSLSA